MQFQLKVNGQDRSVDVAADTPLLWVLRDELNLTGTKYGCGVASCGPVPFISMARLYVRARRRLKKLLAVMLLRSKVRRML